MQPNFTLKNLGFVGIRVFAIALIIGLTTQFSFSQEKQSWEAVVTPQKALNKKGETAKPKVISNQIAVQGKQSVQSDNDAGLPNRTVQTITNRTEAVCTTFVGSVTAADAPTSVRFFRDGVAKTCAVPGTCTAPLTGTFQYKILTWVNPVAQCLTITTSNPTTNFSMVSAYSATPNLANLCSNWIGDQGGSALNGTPIVWSINAPAGTIYFLVGNVVNGQTADYSIVIDAPVCTASPCTGTPAPGNTLATTNPVGPGAPFTLSVQNNPAVSGLVHTWQSSPTGAAPWTNLANGPANTYATSQIVQTYYRDSVRCTSSSLSGISTPILVTMSPCGWSSGTVVPVPILDAPSVTIGSNLYTFGGVSNGAIIGTSYRFNGTTWSTIAPLPQILEFASASSDGTNAYILGGAAGSGVPQTTMYRYSPSSNSYTTLAPFTVGTWNQASVVLNCKIYKIGGTTATASSAVLEIYDIPSNTWSLGAPLPAPTSFPAVFVNGGFIYMVGGLNATGTVTSAKTYRYDPGTDTWNDAAIADLPATRWGAAGDLYNGRGIIAGGYVGGAVTANISTSVLAWDPLTNTWSTELPMSGERARMTGAVLNNAFYVIGGRSVASAGFNGENSNQRFACTLPACSGTPNPGNTVGPCTLPCPGEFFTLRLQNNPAVSGLTYQWQSSTAGVGGPYTSIGGATSSTYTATLSVTTWYRAMVSCGANTATSTPVMVVSGQGVFTSHPVNASTVCGGNASFSVSATGAALTWLWEQRVNSAAPWTLVTNGGIFSGATTTTLTLTDVSQTYTGYQYRAVMQGTCTAPDFSNAATLTVTSIITNVTPSSATICLGAVQQLSITNSLALPTTVSFSNNTLLPIPDNLPAGVYSTIPVAGIPAGSVITGMSVTMNATHTWVGDLEINLIAPNNVSMNLIGELDGGTGSNSSDHFVNTVMSSASTTPMSGAPAPRTGTFAADRLNGYGPSGGFQTSPDGMPWSALQTVMNGNWQLGLSDWAAGDFGSLQNWTLTITYKAPVFAQGTWTGPAGTMFTNVGATTAYTGTPATTIFVKPLATGVNNYNVSFTTPTPCTSATTTIPITVHSPVTGLAVSPATRAVCLGGSTTFTASTTGGTPVNYQWQVSTDGGVTYTNLSSASATTATLAVNGVTALMNNNRYRVQALNNVCGTVTSSNAGVLTVNALPVVTITSPDLALTPPQTTVITASSTPAALNAASWSWTRNGSAIAGTSNTQTVSIDIIGAYQATVTDVNGCVNKSNILVIGSEASDRLWIYPNPNTGAFQVRLYYDSDVTERRRVTLYNAIGQVVTSKIYTLADNTAPYLRMDFDLSNLAAGTYVVKVAHEFSGKVVSGLVIVQ